MSCCAALLLVMLRVVSASELYAPPRQELEETRRRLDACRRELDASAHVVQSQSQEVARLKRALESCKESCQLDVLLSNERADRLQACIDQQQQEQPRMLARSNRCDQAEKETELLRAALAEKAATIKVLAESEHKSSAAYNDCDRARELLALDKVKLIYI